LNVRGQVAAAEPPVGATLVGVPRSVKTYAKQVEDASTEIR
jgi:hypothetical protein